MRFELIEFFKGPLDPFFAERHTTESNFRIDTSIGLIGQARFVCTSRPCKPWRAG